MLAGWDARVAWFREKRIAVEQSVDTLLRRVLRDCWWLSAIVFAVIFVPNFVLSTLPGWYDSVALTILVSCLGIAGMGWIVAIRDKLLQWPGLSLALTITLPLGMAILGRIEARKIVAQSFGISPDSLPMTLDMLTAVTTLWWLFIGVGALLSALLIGLLILQLMRRSGATLNLLRTFSTIFPISALVALPPASLVMFMPGLPDLARVLDGQEYHRCAFAGQSSLPTSIVFLSDTKVLAWISGSPQPAVLNCDLR